MRRRPGGWLALLVVLLLLAGPAELILSTLLDQRTSEARYPELSGSHEWWKIKLVAWSIVATQIAVMIATALRLMSVFRRSTVRFSILCLWLIGPIANVAYTILVNAAFGAHTHVDAFSTACAFVFSGVWTAYLILSDRVRRTYPALSGEHGSLAATFD